MNILLIFFAFPIATIIISAILQKLLKNPFVVSAFIFAIFIVVTFAAFDETFLIATLAYTILSFVTAIIVKLISNSNNDEDSLCRELLSLLQNIIDNNNNTSENNDDEDELNNCGCGCNTNRYRFRKY